MPDLSLFPESVLMQQAIGNPVVFGQENKERIARLVDAADLALKPFPGAKPGIVEALASEDPWERWWALTVCCVFGKEAASLAGEARELLADEELPNRARAAVFLALAAEEDPGPVIREALRSSESPDETLIILNMVVFLRDGGPGIDIGLKGADVKMRGGEVDRRIWYLTGEGDPRGEKGLKAKETGKGKAGKKKREP